MQTHVNHIADVFQAQSLFEIPPYQREYQWGEEQWHNLWRDLGFIYEQCEKGEKPANHFMGILLVERMPDSGISEATRLQVIDGQQRLTTLLILLAAIRDADWDSKEVAESHRKQHGLFWVRNHDQTIAGPRLHAQETDHPGFMKAMDGGWKEWRIWYRDRVLKEKEFLKERSLYAYTYFRHLMWLGRESFLEDATELPAYKPKEREDDVAVEQVWERAGLLAAPKKHQIDLAKLNQIVMSRLDVLTVQIEQKDEDAPTIFESINAKRTELQQWDFIRNLIFTRFDRAEADRLYAGHWKDVQETLNDVSWEGKRSDARDAFVYDYLIARGEHKEQGSVGRNRGYEHLRHRLSRIVRLRPGSGYDNKYRSQLRAFVVEDFLAAAKAWPVAVGYRPTLIGEKISVPEEASRLIESISKFSAGPPFPAILHFIEGWGKSEVSDGKLLLALELIESLLARAVLAKRPLSPLRSVFMGIMDDLQGTYDVSKLKQILKEKAGNARLALTDKELAAFAAEQDYYRVSGVSGTQLGAIFRGIERELSGPKANPLPYGSKKDDFTVEHIFPTSCCSPPFGSWNSDIRKWKSDGARLAQVVDRLGNLTLLTFGANNHVKAKAFRHKKVVLANKDGKVQHPILSISDDVVNADRWTEKEVNARTKKLIGIALRRWRSL